MKRRLHDNSDRESGRSNLQRTITSMFNQGGSKFVGVTGVLVFPLQLQNPSSVRFCKSEVHA